MAAIEKHDGHIIQFVGDAVSAYWPPEQSAPSHAQLAYDAARDIIQTLPRLLRKQRGVSYSLRVDLGTGEMAGDYFGPIKQFQVIGKGVAIAERLSRLPSSDVSCIRMSQYTFNLVQPRDGIIQTETVTREPLEELSVYSWMPERSR